MKKINKTYWFINIICLVILLSHSYFLVYASPNIEKKYSRIMWNYLALLTGFGPRYVGTKGYDETLNLIKQVGAKFADGVLEHPIVVRRQNGEELKMMNIEFIFNGTKGGRPVLLGAHYDTRPYADQETDIALHDHPIVGANDGGSGTAILLGLAQYLKSNPVSQPIRLIFFDGEDFGKSGSGEMFIGSNYHAMHLQKLPLEQWPQGVIIIDMVGDKELEIFKENYSIASGGELLDRIYKIALRKKIHQFNEKSKYTIRDDHLPFINLGIPSILLIDFDYPHWHKLSDTLDKCSSESLGAVFSVVTELLKEW